MENLETSLPLSLAVEQSHRDDLTRSQLCKLTTPGGKGSVGQGGPTPCHTHLRPTSLQSTVESSWDYCGTKCSDKRLYDMNLCSFHRAGDPLQSKAAGNDKS